MTRTRKVVVLLLLVTVLVGAVRFNAARAGDNSKTYAYLPDHSVYYYDVAEGYDWAHREIDALSLQGVIRGSGDHLFDPSAAITRADFIVMLDRVYGMSSALDKGIVQAAEPFTDVSEDAYYAHAVNAARAWGITTGSADNHFHPKASMTRQDAMVFLERTLQCANVQLMDGAIGNYADAQQVGDYASGAVGKLIAAHVVNGSGTQLNPLQNISRAEIAVLLYRATHMTVQDSGIFYESRGDIVNICVGDKVYGDVVIENYDPQHEYRELMRYSKIHEDENGIRYITLEEAQPINASVVIGNEAEFTRSAPTEKDPEATETTTYPMADDCVAIDVDHYHRIDAPVSTGSEYAFCYPSIDGGKVVAIYYKAENTEE